MTRCCHTVAPASPNKRPRVVHRELPVGAFVVVQPAQQGASGVQVERGPACVHVVPIEVSVGRLAPCLRGPVLATPFPVVASPDLVHAVLILLHDREERRPEVGLVVERERRGVRVGGDDEVAVGRLHLGRGDACGENVPGGRGRQGADDLPFCTFLE